MDVRRDPSSPLLLLTCATFALACGDSTTSTTSEAEGADAGGADAHAMDGDVPDVADAEAEDDAQVDAADTGPHGDADAQSPTAPSIDALSASENPDNALSFFVTWQTDQPATTSLSFECGEDDAGATIASDTLGLYHRVFVMGLLEDARCSVSVTSENAEGLAATSSTELVTSTLPEASFPSATVTRTEPDRLQPGWNLITLINHFDGLPLRAVLIDSQGRYRWYYESALGNPGADNDLRTVPGGVLIGGIPATRPRIVDWDGTQRWQGNLRMHHHIMLWPDDEHVFFIRALGDDSCASLEWKGYAIATIQRIDDKEIAWEWSLCSGYSPGADVRDWEHANTLEPFPGENAFIESARNQNALFRVNRDTEAVEWVLGFGGRPQDGFNGDFAMAEEDRFFRQHAPEVQTDGHILLFDNGLAGYREESRAVEIAYDEGTMTAEVVWEYRHEPPLFTDIWGDADALPNGNRLVTFGFRDTAQGSVLVEALPETDHSPAWVLELPPKWGIYRTERVVDPPRGHVILPAE